MKPHPKELIEEFFRKYPLLQFQKNEVIMRPGERINYVVYVMSGMMKLYGLTPSGREYIIGFINTNRDKLVYGTAVDMSDNWFIETLTPVQLYRAPKEQFIEFVAEHREVHGLANKSMIEFMGDLFQQMLWLKTGDATFRIKSALCHLARTLGTRRDNAYFLDGFRLTHQLIADYLGLARETVAIEVGKMAKQGYLEYRDRVLVISDPGKMECSEPFSADAS